MQAATAHTSSFTDLAGLAQISQLGRQDRAAALDEVGRQFESLFLSQVLRSVRSATEALNPDGLFSGWELKFRQEMFDQQISLSLAQSRGLGLAPFISRQLQNQLSDAESPSSSPTEGVLSAPSLQAEPALPLRAEGEAISRRLPRHSGSLDDVQSAMPTVPSSSLPAAHPASSRAAHPSSLRAAGEAISTDLPRATVLEDDTNDEPAQFNSPSDFLSALAPLARRAAQRLGLDTAVLLAQSALETGWGAAISAGKEGSSRNLFNIKAGDDWQGPSVSVSTVEFRGGIAVQEQHRFRSYRSFAESFNDFVDFLQAKPRYQLALRQAREAESFVRGLQEAGYATDPNYADKILDVLSRVRELVEDI